MSDGKNINEKTDDIQLRSFKKALDKSWSLMNAHQMHLEILRMKTAMQLILSENQYASLEFVGRHLFSEETTKNHLELQDKVDENPVLRMSKAIEYFEELSRNKSQDPLDLKFKNAFLKGVFDRDRD